MSQHHYLARTLLRPDGTPVDVAVPTADPQDVRTFQEALGTGSVATMLAAFSGDHAGQVRRVERNLLRAARTADPERMLQLNKQYSSLMLEHAFAMKVVGKTVQSIDGITKLQ
jgi:hypothetical protein